MFEVARYVFMRVCQEDASIMTSKFCSNIAQLRHENLAITNKFDPKLTLCHSSIYNPEQYRFPQCDTFSFSRDTLPNRGALADDDANLYCSLIKLARLSPLK